MITVQCLSFSAETSKCLGAYGVSRPKCTRWQQRSRRQWAYSQYQLKDCNIQQIERKKNWEIGLLWKFQRAGMAEIIKFTKPRLNWLEQASTSVHLALLDRYVSWRRLRSGHSMTSYWSLCRKIRSLASAHTRPDRANDRASSPDNLRWVTPNDDDVVDLAWSRHDSREDTEKASNRCTRWPAMCRRV